MLELPYLPRPSSARFKMTTKLAKRSAEERLPDAQATAKRLRRFNRMRSQLLTKFGAGDDATQAQMTIANNAAAMSIWCEERVAELLDAGEVNIGEFNTTVNTLRRLLETLGIARAPRDIPQLSEYLAKRVSAPAGYGV